MPKQAEEKKGLILLQELNIFKISDFFTMIVIESMYSYNCHYSTTLMMTAMLWRQIILKRSKDSENKAGYKFCNDGF